MIIALVLACVGCALQCYKNMCLGFVISSNTARHTSSPTFSSPFGSPYNYRWNQRGSPSMMPPQGQICNLLCHTPDPRRICRLQAGFIRFSTHIAAIGLFLASSANGFSVISTSNRASTTVLNAGVRIYYSSSTGNTETVAGYIAEAADGAILEEISDASDADFTGADALIVGAPTWHTDADEQRSGTPWDDWLYQTLPNLELEGKKVAVFGCGDQESYGDYYCDAAGELYDLFAAKGCKMYGFTSTDGYDHTASKAMRDGKFIGCMFDEDNQYDLSEDRAKAWVGQLASEGFM